jgi:cold shock CspA family protein
MTGAVAETKTGSGDAPVCSNEPQKPTVVQEITDALKETKITEEKAPAEAPKAEEGSSVDPQAEKSEKPRKERVFKKKHVLTRNAIPVTGTVKWFNVSRGFGFIERNDDGPDVFLHQSGVIGSGRRHRFSLFLKGGEEVEFDVAQGVKGPEAVAVTSPGGFELAPFNPRYRRGPRRERNNVRKEDHAEDTTSPEESPREPRDSNNNRPERPERRRRVNKLDKNRRRNNRKGAKNEPKNEQATNEEAPVAPVAAPAAEKAPAVPNAHLQVPVLECIE